MLCEETKSSIILENISTASYSLTDSTFSSQVMKDCRALSTVEGEQWESARSPMALMQTCCKPLLSCLFSVLGSGIIDPGSNLLITVYTFSYLPYSDSAIVRPCNKHELVLGFAHLIHWHWPDVQDLTSLMLAVCFRSNKTTTMWWQVPSNIHANKNFDKRVEKIILGI